MKSHLLNNGIQQFRLISRRSKHSIYIDEDCAARIFLKILGGCDELLPEALNLKKKEYKEIGNRINRGEEEKEDKKNPEEIIKRIQMVENSP